MRNQNELTPTAFQKLLDTGMLWEIYTSATSDPEEDPIESTHCFSVGSQAGLSAGDWVSVK
jgi:hypothetical protein